MDKAVVVPASDDCLIAGTAGHSHASKRHAGGSGLEVWGPKGPSAPFPAASQTNQLLSLLITLAYLFTLGLAYGRERKHTPPHAERLACNSPLFPSIPPSIPPPTLIAGWRSPGSRRHAFANRCESHREEVILADSNVS